MKTTKIFLVAIMAMAFANIQSMALNSDTNNKLKTIASPALEEAELYNSYLSKQFLEVPFTMVHDHFLIVEVSVNGEKLNFLFDETSLHTAINKEKAELLGVNGETQLFIGGQSFTENLIVSDFTRLKASGLNVDGIIGSSIVDYYNISLDLAMEKIICVPF